MGGGVIIKVAIPPMTDPQLYVEELNHKFKIMHKYIRELEERLGIYQEKLNE